LNRAPLASLVLLDGVQPRSELVAGIAQPGLIVRREGQAEVLSHEVRIWPLYAPVQKRAREPSGGIRRLVPAPPRILDSGPEVPSSCGVVAEHERPAQQLPLGAKAVVDLPTQVLTHHGWFDVSGTDGSATDNLARLRRSSNRGGRAEIQSGPGQPRTGHQIALD
jgi:hypothetical protein